MCYLWSLLVGSAGNPLPALLHEPVRLWAVRCSSVRCEPQSGAEAVAGSCLAAPLLAARVGKRGSSRGFAVTGCAASSKALAKNIWQGAGESECLIVFFFFACVLFFKEGEKYNSLGRKCALARSHSGAGMGLIPGHRTLCEV